MLKPVFYTAIRPAIGQSELDVIRKAHDLGYELVRFEGYTDADLGYAGNRGPKWEESRTNQAAVKEIQSACAVSFEDGTEDWPQVFMARNESEI